MRVELGDEAIDMVSGFTGIVVARYEYLNGCSRIALQPKVRKDGSLPEASSFDEPQLKVKKAGKISMGPSNVGGPEKFMPQKRPE